MHYMVDSIASLTIRGEVAVDYPDINVRKLTAETRTSIRRKQYIKTDTSAIKYTRISKASITHW